MKFDYVRLRDGLRKAGFYGAVVAVVGVAVWISCMVIVGVDGPAKARVAAHPVLFRLNFGASVIYTLAQIPVALAFGMEVLSRAPARAVLGTVTYLLYVPLAAVCYFLNGAFIPRLVTGGVQVASPLISALDMGSPFSLFGGFAVLGYGILGLGWIVLASALFKRSRLWNAVSMVALLGGIASVLGALGLFIDSSLLASGSLIGGGLSFVFYILFALTQATRYDPMRGIQGP